MKRNWGEKLLVKYEWNWQQADVGQVLENVPQIPQFNVGQESNEYLTQKTVEPYRPNLNRGPNIEAIEEDEPFREDVEQEGYGSDPGQVLCKDEEVSTRFEFETVCKNYTPRICDDDDDSDCGPTQICYKRPRLLTRDTGTGTRCRKRFDTKKLLCFCHLSNFICDNFLSTLLVILGLKKGKLQILRKRFNQRRKKMLVVRFPINCTCE